MEVRTRVHCTHKGKVKISKSAFGSMIFLWRLTFQRDFVLKLFLENAFLLFKNETEKKFFFGYLRRAQGILQKTFFFTEFSYPIYYQNVII